MKYLSLLLLWMVILAGTWTDLGQEFFGPTQELREISKSQPVQEQIAREPSYAKTTTNPNLSKAQEYLAKGLVKDAVVEYEAALSNKAWAHENPKKWAENMQSLMTITDPSLALELLSSFNEQGSVPESMRETVTLWRVHAQAWAKADNSQGIIQAKELLDKADELRARRPSRPDGLVLYLRSAAILNPMVRSPAQEKNQEALLLAGRAAEGLKDRENLSNFLQKCVSIDANSEIGQACIRKQSQLTANHLLNESAD